MLAKVLCVSDLHKRYAEAKSVRGQLNQQRLIQEDLIKYCIQEQVTHVIILGDWYDRGFHGIGQAYSAIELDRRLSAAVNGNVYICLGNHFYLDRDDNPEMYIIQPDPVIKPKIDIATPDTPIFKRVDELRIGNVLFSFFHFNKLHRNYKNDRPNDITFHIGIYHDDICVPAWVRENEGFGKTNVNGLLSEIYENIDLAIHGHIHYSANIVKYELMSGKTVPLWIPGALAITQNKEVFKHASVSLPLLIINDDSSVTTKAVSFSTHMECLSFYEIVQKKKKQLKVSEMSHIHQRSANLTSLRAYLTAKGYTESQLEIINNANLGTLDMRTVLKIIKTGDKNEQLSGVTNSETESVY